MHRTANHAARTLLCALGLLLAGSAAGQFGGPPPGPYGVPHRYPMGPDWRPPHHMGGRGMPGPYRQGAEDYVRNAPRIVDSTDWNDMRTVTVELSEFKFEPSKLRFRAGAPYKLELRNVGGVKHYFTAPRFFRSIATRKVQSNHDGEIKAPYFTALEMMPNGGQLDLYFVPVHPGRYEVECTVPGHAEKGMVGTIVVE